MSRTARAIAASAALMFSLHMVSLQGEQKSGKPAPAPHAAKTTTAKAPTPKAATTPTTGKHATARQQAPKASTAKATAPKGPGSKAATKPAKLTTQKTKPSTKPAAVKTEKKDAKTAKTASTKKADAKKNTDAASTATTATTTTPPLENLSPVQQKLAKNTNLASKLQGRLPAGTNLMDAADGFRNLGQFVAAVNVSNNLKIPFDKLKADMVTKKMSLGQSIQDLRPETSSATVEAQHAEYDANTTIAQTDQETTASVSAKVTQTTTTTPPPPTTTTKTKTHKSSHKTLTGGE